MFTRRNIYEVYSTGIRRYTCHHTNVRSRQQLHPGEDLAAPVGSAGNEGANQSA